MNLEELIKDYTDMHCDETKIKKYLHIKIVE